MTVQNKTISPADNIDKSPVSIECASDKSLTHRSIMFASLAKGRSKVLNPLLGADCLSTVSCFKKMGVQISVSDSEINVESGGIDALKSPTDDLDCGNSGTTSRLLLGLLSGIEGLKARLTGDESLESRPMARVTDLLEQAGAEFEFENPNKTLPITVTGKKLSALDYNIKQSSAQVKSAVLLANINTNNKINITLPSGSRDHTENFIKLFSGEISTSIKSDLESISYNGPTVLREFEYKVPVDPSSAAFFAVAGLLLEKEQVLLPNVNFNPTRLGFLKVLERMSPNIHTELKPDAGFVEPVCDIRIKGGQKIEATNIEAHEIPSLVDEIPILAVLASFCDVPSIFRDLGELRVKESDRLAKTFELLEKAGCGCKIIGDDLHIEGGLKVAKAFTYDSEGDHRLAMSAAIMALKAESDCQIINSECVNVSFPNFYELLNSL